MQNSMWPQNSQRPTRPINLPVETLPQSQPSLQAPFQLPSNPQPPIRPQFPAQPNPNPNNRPAQYVQIVENSDYEVNPLECNKLWLRSRRVVFPENDKVN